MSIPDSDPSLEQQSESETFFKSRIRIRQKTAGSTALLAPAVSCESLYTVQLHVLHKITYATYILSCLLLLRSLRFPVEGAAVILNS